MRFDIRTGWIQNDYYNDQSSSSRKTYGDVNSSFQRTEKRKNEMSKRNERILLLIVTLNITERAVRVFFFFSFISRLKFKIILITNNGNR